MDGIGVAGVQREGEGWVLEVVPAIANPWNTMYGGAGLAAAVDVASAASGRTVRWASTRFLRSPKIGQRLSLSYRADAVGRRTSHVSVGAHADGKTYFDTTLVVGGGSTDDETVTGQWARMPDVPPPDECAPIPWIDKFAGFAVGRSERRVALGPHPWLTNERGPGRVATWFRLSDGDASSPGGLAWAADCVALGLGQAVGGLGRATSLDNTIRYAADTTSEWLLVDTHAVASVDGYAYGHVHCFAEDGTLLATGTQTCLARLGDPPFATR
jgi:acyl-CoA thioesterase-2